MVFFLIYDTTSYHMKLKNPVEPQVKITEVEL